MGLGRRFNLEGLYPGKNQADPTAPDPSDSVNNKDVFPFVRHSIASALSPEESCLIATIFGITNGIPNNLEEAAETLEIPIKEAKEIYDSALQKLRKHLLSLGAFLLPTQTQKVQEIQETPPQPADNIVPFTPIAEAIL